MNKVMLLVVLIGAGACQRAPLGPTEHDEPRWFVARIDTHSITIAMEDDVGNGRWQVQLRGDPGIYIAEPAEVGVGVRVQRTYGFAVNIGARYTFTGLEPSTRYAIRVRRGNGPWGVERVVQTLGI